MTEGQETWYAPGRSATAIYILPTASPTCLPPKQGLQGLAYNNSLTDWKTVDALHNDFRTMARSMKASSTPGTFYRGGRNILAGLCRGSSLTVTLCKSTKAFGEALARDTASEYEVVFEPSQTEVSNLDTSTVLKSDAGAVFDAQDSGHDPNSIATLFGTALAIPVAERRRHGPDGDGYVSDTELVARNARSYKQTRSTAESP